MAIANRDLGAGQQMMSLPGIISTSVAASAAQSFQVAQVPSAGTLMQLAIAANSVSGAPVVSIGIKRWTGAGVTTIPYVGTTLTVTPHGISLAYQSVSLAAPSSTLCMLQAGDVIVLTQEFSGGNVAIGNAVVTAVVQATQDLKQTFGMPTTLS